MPSTMSPAGVALFGNTGVAVDPGTQGETEEERRKRLAQLQSARSKINGSLSAGFGGALNSPSAAGSALGF
jgi:hypothetical protein